MAQETLYLKWRPKDFDEVVGQGHVTRTLRNAARSGRQAHAYLFAGPRGTGKTSCARILAKALNCLAEPEQRPCNACHICQEVNQGRFLDLIEIDGASNRGIDEIRELRDKVNYRPNEGRYKVYIIDEVHMLTREAFNALLKTLEEPPEYVVFIFATTEVWRVPATIRSRCQRFDFRPLRLPQIEARLNQICEGEGIARDDKAIAILARQAGGALRDAISMLDQVSSVGDGMVTADLVRAILGTAPDEACERLLSSLLAGDLAGALEQLGQFAAEGLDMRQFTQGTLDLARAMLLMRLGAQAEVDVPQETLARLGDLAQGVQVEQLLRLTRSLSQAVDQVRNAYLPQLPLELALVEANAYLHGRPEPTLAGVQPAATTAAPAAAAPSPQLARQREPVPGPGRPGPVTVAPQRVAAMGVAEPPPLDLQRLQKLWLKVGAKVRLKDRTLEPLLRSSEPVALQGEHATVAFAYPFHRSVFEGEEERKLLIEAVREVTGRALELDLVVQPPRQTAGAESAAPPAEAAAAAATQPQAEAPSEPLPLEQDPLYHDAIALGGQPHIVETEDE